MRKWISLFLLIFTINSQANENITAFKELQSITRLPYSELKRYLSDCEDSQQSMYFCAWRDYLIAKNKLQTIVNEKKKILPKCAKDLQTQIDKWNLSLNHDCRKYSIKEYGEGSLQPTDQMLCMISSTGDAEKAVRRINNCSQVRKLNL